MTEFEEFMKSVSTKSDATKKQYKNQYLKLVRLTDKPIAETGESKILDILSEIDNRNTQNALLNISLLIRKMKGLSISRLETLREKNKSKLTESVKAKNVSLKENLPSYQDLLDYNQYLYGKNEYIDFIINYLLINVQVRNRDLDFEIVTRKRDADDKEKNYMFLQNNLGKVQYIRNVYKTAKIIKPDGRDVGHGQKINIIKDKQFIHALRRVLDGQKKGLDTAVFIPTKSAIAYYIMKATYKQLGEGNYFKVVVNHFRNDPLKLKEISENRGTNIVNILDNYDIENQ